MTPLHFKGLKESSCAATDHRFLCVCHC